MSKSKAVKLVEDYLDKSDWRVFENANSVYSYASFKAHLSNSIEAEYVLEKMYPKDIAELHKNGDIHIHDLSNGLTLYCMGWSLKDILEKGFVCRYRDCNEFGPAKRLSAILGQIVNFIGTLQLEAAGAQALNCIDTYIAPFIRENNLTYDELYEEMQSFVCSCNINSRWGQKPFFNLSFDLSCPQDMKKTPIIIGGKIQEGKYYGDYQKEIDMFNKAFLEVMLKGDSHGRIFTFPIPTYSVTKSFDWDSDVGKLLFDLTAKYGTPYFQNFINSEINPEDVRSMCCRLSLDLKELQKKNGGLFGAGDKTGSLGVCTINMPKIGYTAKDEDDFYSKFDYVLDKCKEALLIKREKVQHMYDNNMLPYTKEYLHTLRNHFNTIGILGMNECCMNFIKCDIGSPEGLDFSIRVLKHMNERLIEFQEETGLLFNLEASPCESTTYRLAKKDKEIYPDIITAGVDVPYYTNSSLLPVGYTTDVFECLELQEPLQILYTGGTVLHVFLDEEITGEQAKLLVKLIFNKYKVPYLTITPTFSICPTHGYINGKHETCPTCGDKCGIFSRVNGYIRDISSWNIGKKEEFRERTPYKP